MAVHYEVPIGKTFMISGPANVTVRGGETPMVIDDAAEFQSSIPTITSLNPTSVESGTADITLEVLGTGFTADSIIVFADLDEPTTFDAEANSVSTGVKPSLFAPAIVKVCVRNGPARSQSTNFEFTAPGGAARQAKSREK